MVTIAEQQETESARLETEITRVVADIGRYTKLAETTHGGESEKWQGMAAQSRTEGRKLIEGRGLISKGYTYEDIVAGASQYAVAAARRKQAVTQYVAGLSSVEKSQYESLRRQGYTPESAQKVVAWSSKYQMSPSSETIARVLAGEDVKPFREPAKAPTYTLFGKTYKGEEVERFRGRAAEYISPEEKLYTAIGLERKKTPFGEFYGGEIVMPKKVPTPLAISAYEGPVIPTERTLWEATGEAVTRIPTGIQMAATGLITEFEPSEGLRYIFEPFKYAGELKGEEKIAVLGAPQFGTAMPEEYLLPEYKPFKGTKFEYAEMKGFESLPEYYERTGTRVSKYAPIVVETAALIGASVISPAMRIAIVPSYIFGISTKQTIEAPTISGKALGVVGMGLGLYGFGAGISGLQRAITMEELKSAIAIKPQYKLGVRETLKGGIVKDIYKAEYQVGGVKIIKGAEIYTKPISGERFAMFGRGEVYAKTYEYMTGKEIYYGAITKLKGLGVGLGVRAEGWQPSISIGKVSKQMEFLIREGKGKITYYPPSAQVPEKFIVGGISKEAREKIIALGGRVKEFQKPWVTREGIVIKSAEFKVPVEEIALIKIKQPAPSDIGFIRTTGLKSPQEYFQKLYAPPTPIVAEKLIQAPSIKIQPSIPPPSIIGAGAIISKVKLKDVIKPITKDIIISREKEVLIQPSKVRAIVKVKEIQKAISIPKAEIRMITIPREKLMVAQVPAMAQVSILKQELKLKQALITVPVTGVPSPLISPTGVPPPVIPLIILSPFFKPKKEIRKIIKVKRIAPTTKYKPSLLALALDIRAPKIPKAYTKGMGALIVRPIISKEKKGKVIRVRRKSQFQFKMPTFKLRGLIRAKRKKK